jgi:hypothetical protein
MQQRRSKATAATREAQRNSSAGTPLPNPKPAPAAQLRAIARSLVCRGFKWVGDGGGKGMEEWVAAGQQGAMRATRTSVPRVDAQYIDYVLCYN